MTINNIHQTQIIHICTHAVSFFSHLCTDFYRTIVIFIFTTSGVKHSTKLDCFTPPFVAQTLCAERYSSYSFAQLHFEDMAAKSVPPDVLRKYDVENEIARYVDVTFNFINFINLPQATLYCYSASYITVFPRLHPAYTYSLVYGYKGLSLQRQRRAHIRAKPDQLLRDK